MITAPMIDLISDFLMVASDHCLESGYETYCETLRSVCVKPEALPEWAETLIQGFRDEHGIDLAWSGSRIICPGSAEEGSDWDFYGNVMQDFLNHTPNGWDYSGHYSDYMHCFRGNIFGNNVNLILFSLDFEDLIDRFSIATDLCRSLRVSSKSMRIALFQLVLYGNVNPIAEQLTTLTGDNQ